MGDPQKVRAYTLEDYFELDESAEFHYEYHNGEVFAMAGGTLNHSVIAMNLGRAIGNQLGDREFLVAGSDAKVQIQSENSYVHPDVMVICGDPEFMEGRTDTVKNPVLVIEVLSDKTGDYDRGEKFAKYRKLKSLQEYVLVNQKKRLVEPFFKNEEEIWTIGEHASGKDLHLRSLNIFLSFDDIYARVTFPEPEDSNSSTLDSSQ